MNKNAKQRKDDKANEGYYSAPGHIYWEGETKINYIKGNPKKGIEERVEYFNPDGGLDRVEYFSNNGAMNGDPKRIDYFRGCSPKN